MRLPRIILHVVIVFLTSSAIMAHQWEFQFSIKSSGQFIIEGISIYYYDYSGKKYIGCGGGSSLNYPKWEGSWNAIGNISGITDDERDATFTINNYDRYAIVIGNQYVVIENTYGDQTFNYHDGVLTTEGNNTVLSSGTWTEYTITLKNNFAGGVMYINSEWHSNIPLSGKNVTRTTPTFPHELTAVDEQMGADGYKRLWEKWSNDEGDLSQHLNSQGNYTYEAQFDKEYNLTFVANSTMYINSNQRTSSWIEYVREQSSNSAYATNYSLNYIDYTFTNWTSEGQSYSSPITAADHATYTAVYSGKPNNGYRSLSFNYSQEGQPVQVMWLKHPLDNSSITHYAIYRKVTTSGTPTLLTTVNANQSSSYTYTDYDYVISSGDNKILLFYDVRAYYSPSSAYSDPDFAAVYGMENYNILPDNKIAEILKGDEIPQEYSTSNHPNPFNPTTTISYQLPENSFVTIKVFDILGKEVATLVNENKPAGYFSVNFDGSKLSSGIYIYTLSANGIIYTKKMLLAK